MSKKKKKDEGWSRKTREAWYIDPNWSVVRVQVTDDIFDSNDMMRSSEQFAYEKLASIVKTRTETSKDSNKWWKKFVDKQTKAAKKRDKKRAKR